MTRVTTVWNMQFKAVASPDGQYSIVPADLTILIPKARRIVAEDRHYLAYIPWQTKYLAHIPAEHQEFFLYVLPFLHARTSNVHTALSISQLAHLLPAFEGSVDTHLVYLALILHDCGWSKVTQEGLLHSLSYSGVTPSNPDSMKPKQQHLIFGEALAYELLDSFDFGEQPLSSHDIYTISEIIRRHDHDAAWEQDKYGYISDEVRIVCDADRLWSYTYENFWLDTVRKGVNPETYIETINQEITGYFFTDLGRARARQLLSERRTEVAAYARLLSSTAKVEELARSARYASNRMGYRAHQLFLSAQSRRLQRAFIRQKTY